MIPSICFVPEIKWKSKPRIPRNKRLYALQFRHLKPDRSTFLAVKAVFESVSDLITKATMATYFSDPYIFEIMEEIRYLESVLNSLESELFEPTSDLDEVIKKQEKILHTLRYDFAVKMTNLEQKIRRNWVRIFGIPETPGGEEEDIIAVVLNFFLCQLKVVLSRSDIEDAYRVGKEKGKYPRAVVVKFVSYEARNEIFSRRHMIQEQCVGIYDELCPERARILKQAKRIFGKRNVYVKAGVIEVRIQDGNFKKFLTLAQLTDFVEEQGFEVCDG